jgi:guanine nucleotide-binding protein subunit alpha
MHIRRFKAGMSLSLPPPPLPPTNLHTNQRLSQSQTDEALALFKEVSNLSIFKRAALVLFLNKIDLLRWKLQTGMSPVRRYYPDYRADPTDVKACQAYFADKFKRLYRDKEKQLYIQFTTATDTDLLTVTMESVRRMILQHNFATMIL